MFKILAIYNGTQYMKDSKGNVYKFVNGYMDISYPFVKLVGKVTPVRLPKNFDSHFYTNGLTPIDCYLYKTNKNDIFRFER